MYTYKSINLYVYKLKIYKTKLNKSLKYCFIKQLKN